MCVLMFVLRMRIRVRRRLSVCISIGLRASHCLSLGIGLRMGFGVRCCLRLSHRIGLRVRSLLSYSYSWFRVLALAWALAPAWASS